VARAEVYLHAKFYLDVFSVVCDIAVFVLKRDVKLQPTNEPSVQPFGHNTPMSQSRQTDRTDIGLVASDELFYKRLPKNADFFLLCSQVIFS